MFKKIAHKRILQAVFLIAVICIPTIANAAGIAWRQPLERVWYAYSPTVSAYTWWTDSWCDGDPSDVDYMYMFVFPSAVTNPNDVRSFSHNLAVDSMLLWYQTRYGGVNASGNTSSPNVYVCIGDTGANMAGGPSNVYSHLKLLR